MKPALARGPVHWTYEEPKTGADLEQGDVLEPTPQLREALGQAHQYFLNPKYTHFAIVSQSCDLVRRGGPPGANVITLAVVRSLDEAQSKLLRLVARPEAGTRVFSTKSKGAWTEFLNKLFNQNQQSHGLFYLHEDADVKISQPSVVFLRVAVGLRARDHYETLVDARVTGLRPEYRAKFGWLAGNLYARAATRDWKDHDGGREQLKELVRRYSDKPRIEASGPLWVRDEKVRLAKEKGVLLDGKSDAEIAQRLSREKVPNPKDQLSDVALRVIQDVLSANPPSPKQLRQISAKLKSDETINQLLPKT